ncbi:prp38 family domain-containing protein [Cyclospora cayetanensis]|uniref:Prp38 family domain-containing protein n=1 Tax=Cyclospora cayetanensis TaxID=88456 RepID=A0A1D3D7W2_9EIME|nr:prp38 family domain-containing protein [Cyclospora cayetanensis]
MGTTFCLTCSSSGGEKFRMERCALTTFMNLMLVPPAVLLQALRSKEASLQQEAPWRQHPAAANRGAVLVQLRLSPVAAAPCSSSNLCGEREARGRAVITSGRTDTTAVAVAIALHHQLLEPHSMQYPYGNIGAPLGAPLAATPHAGVVAAAAPLYYASPAAATAAVAAAALGATAAAAAAPASVVPIAAAAPEGVAADKDGDEEEAIARCHLHTKPQLSCKFCRKYKSFTQQMGVLQQRAIAAEEETQKKNMVQMTDSTTYNVNQLLRGNIMSSEYFKSLHQFKSFQEVVEELAAFAEHAEPYCAGSTRAPSTLFCCLYKLFTLKLTEKQMHTLLNNRDSPYVRCTGFLYLRYVHPPDQLWKWYEPYFLDDEQFTPGADPNRVVSMGEYIQSLLTEDKYFSTVLPRLPVLVKNVYGAQLMTLPQHRKRKAFNRAHIECFTPAAKCIALSSGDWLEGAVVSVDAKGVWVRLEDGNVESIDIGLVQLLSYKTEGSQPKPKRERERDSRRRSRSAERNAAKTQQQLLQEFRRKEQEKALATGKDYARRPTSYKSALSLKMTSSRHAYSRVGGEGADRQTVLSTTAAATADKRFAAVAELKRLQQQQSGERTARPGNACCNRSSTARAVSQAVPSLSEFVIAVESGAAASPAATLAAAFSPLTVRDSARMDSLFLLNDAGSFLLEKHYRGRVGRIACEPLLQQLQQHGPKALLTAPRIMKTSDNCVLLHIHREKLLLAAACTSEAEPLLLLETLQQLYDRICRYCCEGSSLTEEAVRRNFSAVYVLVDVAVDWGYPFILEENLLQLLLQPSSVVAKAMQLVQGSSRMLTSLAASVGLGNQQPAAIQNAPEMVAGAGLGTGSGHGEGSGLSGSGSDCWWRRGAVNYASNEVYVDLIEKISGVVDRFLSGIPELCLSIRQPEALQHAAFHPSISLTAASGSIRLVPAKQVGTINKPTTFAPFSCLPPFGPLTMNAFASHALNALYPLIVWELPAVPFDSPPQTAEGTVSLVTDEGQREDVTAPHETRLVAQVNFLVKNWVPSGLKVRFLRVAIAASVLLALSWELEFRLGN